MDAMGQLHAVGGVRPDGLDRAERAVSALLTAVGQDVTDERLRDTPRRVAESLLDLLTARDVPLTTFPNDDEYSGLVLVRDIPFHSLCEHHMMPFRGVAHIGYVPGARIVGLSTMPRIVEHFSRDLQLQERLTVNVADWMQAQVQPRGVGVVIEAEQLCMSLRGVGTPATRTMTSAFRGVLADAGPLRAQFEAGTS
ncbi:GTP cyclohydrolase I [Lysinimonas soli]|uniref:GTP cyclohydrolase 1 n=1 Tax=Lysinimonas soli TaxID=1074233 RepID=A0ABW0NNG0_9MICO